MRGHPADAAKEYPYQSTFVPFAMCLAVVFAFLSVYQTFMIIGVLQRTLPGEVSPSLLILLVIYMGGFVWMTWEATFNRRLSRRWARTH